MGRPVWSPGRVGGMEGPKVGCHGWAGVPCSLVVQGRCGKEGLCTKTVLSDVD